MFVINISGYLLKECKEKMIPKKDRIKNTLQFFKCMLVFTFTYITILNLIIMAEINLRLLMKALAIYELKIIL